MTKYYMFTDEDADSRNTWYNPTKYTTGFNDIDDIEFCSSDNLFHFCYMGDTIRTVTLPPKTHLHQIGDGSNKKYQSSKGVYLGEKRYLYDPIVIESLISDGCDPRQAGEKIFNNLINDEQYDYAELFLTKHFDPTINNHRLIKCAYLNVTRSETKFKLSDVRTERAIKAYEIIMKYYKTRGLNIPKLLKYAEICTSDGFIPAELY